MLQVHQDSCVINCVLIDDSLKTIAEKEVGLLYLLILFLLKPSADLIQAGLLLNDTSNLIQGKKAKGGDAGN